jgi:hypothetical protein
MPEYLVDVVAAARRLDEAQAAPAASAGTELAECPLGHRNVPGARFCADCGMTMGSLELGPRVDLNAVREAVQGPVTPEERQRREEEHSRAAAANAMAEQAVQDITEIKDPSEKTILVHFVEDGFTWGGKVWQRGEMLQLGPQHPKWESALGWIRLTKQEQFNRYGRVFFDFGPWPGIDAPPGTEIPLGSAAPSRWAHRAGAVPARANVDGSDSLVPW